MKRFPTIVGDLDPQGRLARECSELVSRGERVTLQDSEPVYRQGDAGSHVYVLLEGRLKVTRSEPNGDESLLAIHAPGHLFGLSCLTLEAVRNLNCLAMGKASVVRIRRDAFLDLILGQRDFFLTIMQLVLKRLQYFQARLTEMSAYSVEQRVASVLLRLTESSNQSDGSVRLTHAELAALAGSRRPTVTTALSRLSRSGLIRLGRGSVEVRDRNGIAALLQE